MIRSLHAWASLMRLANGFTALSNIFAGYFLVCFWMDRWFPFPYFLLAATLCFYYGGMILNDVFDYEVDCRERPERMLPRGIINVGMARFLGFYLLICGMVFSWFQGDSSFYISLALALFILIYNAMIKEGIAGSLIMGICRYLNWLLGLSVALVAWNMEDLRSVLSIVLIPVPVLLYVFSLTLLSKEESRARHRWPLNLAAAGLVLTLASAVLLHTRGILPGWHGLILLCLLLSFLLYRLFRLSQRFEGSAIQGTIRLLVLGIIPLDALIVLSASYDSLTGSLAALVVLVLLIPARLLAGRFQVT
ncbi:MAG: UbiA family prenyltransferase [Leptospiraceae bacterium]|nr:UbiA family prenyltransferase [Leptospiraceae bacterium]